MNFFRGSDSNKTVAFCSLQHLRFSTLEHHFQSVVDLSETMTRNACTRSIFFVTIITILLARTFAWPTIDFPLDKSFDGSTDGYQKANVETKFLRQVRFKNCYLSPIQCFLKVSSKKLRAEK
uniref:Uncharacterized protein n=1 Tax=Romanomermis culicivorax TaxID=13658 RepID=A0A915J8A9_ROMCU